MTIDFDPRLDDDPAAWQFHQVRLSNRHMLALGVQRGSDDDLAIVLRRIVPLTAISDAGR